MDYTHVDSAIGPLMLVGDTDALYGLYFSTGDKARGVDPEWRHCERTFIDVAKQLKEYFAGKRKTFDVALQPVGTPFQRSVWRALEDIAYGEVCSYADIAAVIEKPKAVRAVGTANGSNPLAIIVPCHRVVGKDGSLTGFGGGLPAKRYLLDLETRHSGLFA